MERDPDKVYCKDCKFSQMQHDRYLDGTPQYYCKELACQKHVKEFNYTYGYTQYEYCRNINTDGHCKDYVPKKSPVLNESKSGLWTKIMNFFFRS